jgi:hypothetical protein
MNKLYFLITAALLSAGFTGCNKAYLEVDTQQLQEKIYDPTAPPVPEVLGQSTVLYLDHSTCVIDARLNSRVFNALRPQLGQYSDTLCLIRGDVFETIPLNRSDNKVVEVLQTIQRDIPFSDILKAVDQICHSNQQAILITDCEFIRGGLYHDQDPYLSEPLRRWLQKGHVVHVVVEPYRERYRGKLFDKKRFYFIFTDDRMEAPISHNMLAELEPLQDSGLFSTFKLTNSDLRIQGKGEVDNQLDFRYERHEGFDYIEVNDSWEDIRTYVMKLNKYEELMEGEKPMPLIKNLTFNEGENYAITDVGVQASNITAQYLGEQFSDGSKVIGIPDGFMLEQAALQNNRLNVMLTDRIFNYLTDEFGGNLLRLDFVITKVALKPYDPAIFTWNSMDNSGEAICVAKSIENALKDLEVVPTNKDRRVIHTVFIKTGSY